MGNKHGTHKRSKSFKHITKHLNDGFKIASSNNSNQQILITKTNSFEDDYIILNKKLGSGFNGEVVLCQNKLDKQKYALKKLYDNKNSRREISLQWRASIDCENIVKIRDVYQNKINDEKCLLLVMEYMEGGELFDKIKQRKKPFTEAQVAKIMNQICNAVLHLHSLGIAHRDLKPENLLLKTNEDDSIIKLCDFGFAKEAHEGLTTPNYTPYYVPPEILRFQKYDISCDIWSLGVIMYILCCGYPPFYSTHGKRISPGMEKRIKLGKYEFPENEWANVSNEAKSLIDEMLETAPERRLTIDKIMRSKFILGAAAAPRKKLNSIRIMNQDSKNYTEMLDSMGQALNELRVNYDQEIKLKEINEVRNKNPLLKKRLVKKLQQNLENQTIDEENETSKNNTDNENIVNTSKKTVNIADKITIIPNRDKFNFNTDENNNLDENDVTRSKLTRQYSSPVSAIYYSINIKENKNLE